VMVEDTRLTGQSVIFNNYTLLAHLKTGRKRLLVSDGEPCCGDCPVETPPGWGRSLRRTTAAPRLSAPTRSTSRRPQRQWGK
jgi:hypothetical protein